MGSLRLATLLLVASYFVAVHGGAEVDRPTARMIDSNVRAKSERTSKQATNEWLTMTRTKSLEGTAVEGDTDWLSVIPKPHGMMRKGQKLEWKADCFQKNVATVKEFTNEHVIYEIEVSEPSNFYCYDLYVFCSSSNWHMDFYLRRGKHTLKFKWYSDLEREYAEKRGYGVFEVRDGVLGTAKDAWHIYQFFEGVGSEEKNKKFLTDHMGHIFVNRDTAVVNLTPGVDFDEGDFLVINKMVGRWGAFETLEKWVSGSSAGHTAIVMKIDGVYNICESGVEDKDGNEIIGCSPYQDWVDFNLKDESEPNVVILPLSDASRAKFNRDKAENMIKKFLGSPYGFHNLIFSWIDTPEDNYPAPLNSKMMAAALSVGGQILPEKANQVWGEALNKRLGTTGLDTEAIMVEAQRRGIPFSKLLAIPELDSVDYSDGKSFSCVTFAVAVWKAAGVFDGVELQATEFTVKDAYQLKIFNSEYKVPEQCQRDGLPFCQVMGKYILDLPGYNSIEPYSKMNEKCPSLAPDYERPDGC